MVFLLHAFDQQGFRGDRRRCNEDREQGDAETEGHGELQALGGMRECKARAWRVDAARFLPAETKKAALRRPFEAKPEALSAGAP
ncbi:hypothetical protein GCM10025793_18940 [Lysobacter lycopersici]